MTVGEKIRSLRKQRGWEQQDLADRSGLSRTGISNIETGKAKPKLENVQAIASALEMDAAELLGLAATPKAPPAEMVAESTIAYSPTPTTVEQLTQIVGTLTRLVETSQEQQARLLDHQDKLLARLQQAQDQLDKGLDMRAELDKRDAKIATLEGKILAAGAPDSPAVRRLAQ